MKFILPAHNSLRLALVGFSIALGALATWILLAQVYRPDAIEMPLNAQSAAIARANREDARLAATLSVVRGDLWAQSAFTYADLFWATNLEPGSIHKLSDEARMSLEKRYCTPPTAQTSGFCLLGLIPSFTGPDCSQLLP